MRPSAWLVAVMVTVCDEAGAVYRPTVLIVPAPVAGALVHMAAVFLVLVTVAVNCCVCPPYNDALPGATVTRTGGESVTVAIADFVLPAWPVAVTVTVCDEATVAGAVYGPAARIVAHYCVADWAASAETM